MSRDYSKLISYANDMGLSFDNDIIKKFDIFYEMLIEKNKVMNLTAITEFDDVLLKHFIDSISLANLDIVVNNYNILDIGTGAGFPGMPLAIIYPEANFTLADSLNKRIKFIEEVKEAIGLKNVNAVHGRAEELARNKAMRESFDILVSRAVANISTLSEYCLPFVKQGGTFVSYKSGEIEEELKNGKSAIKVLGGEIVDVKHFTLPESDISRSFVIIKKVKSTPGKYPRKAGTPSKEPL